MVDRTALHARGIDVVGLPDYATIAVAEHTLGLLLTLSRRLHLSRDRALGRVPGDTSLRGWQLHGKRLGVIGLGRIGRAVAARASLVDEGAVVAAIHAGALAGYAVDDVLGPTVRPRAGRLLHEGRIVETGHTAWYADEAIARGVDAWVDTLAALARRNATAHAAVA